METLEYIKKTARHYAPEWTPQDSDLGTAFAAAFSFMADQNRLLYERMFDKHYYAFLNSMGAEPPPPRSATGFASFRLSNGAPHGELVPAGSILYNGEIPYTLEDSLYVTPATPVRAYFGCGDVINDALESGGTLAAFNKTASNLQRHEWQISHEWAFNQLDKGSILELDFGKTPPVTLEWCYQGDPQKPFTPVPSSSDGGSAMLLESPGFTGGDFISAFLTPEFADFCIDKIAIRVTSDTVSQARYFHQDAEIADGAAIYPFGKILAGSDCFYIACNEAFSKKNAAIEISFDLSFETFPPVEPQKEPSGDESAEEPEPPEPVQLDSYILEYWNGTGFALLPGYAIEKTICSNFNECILSFSCPPDMEGLILNGLDSRWLRARILEVSQISAAPVRYTVPKISVKNVKYACGGLAPSSVTLINNLESKTFSGQKGAVNIYEPLPTEKPSIYLGFTKPFGTQQISMLIDPLEESPGPGISKLSFYTYTGGEWFSAQTADTTAMLTTSGLLRVLMSRPPDSAELFGHTLYWLRLDMELPDTPADPLPDDPSGKDENTNLGFCLYMNSAAIVQKSAWLRETFILDDGDPAELRLKEKNITDFRIYAGAAEFSGCASDAYEGVITLDPAGLKAYGTPLELTAEYRVTKGFGGNCEPDMITRMAASAGYVQYVTNPLAVNDGWSYETSEQMISVGTKKLRHCGRAVAAGDFEALAYEFAGGLIWCKCRMEDKSGFLTLVYLPRGYPRRYSGNPRPLTVFSNQLKAFLLERCHPALAQGDRFKVREAEYKPLSVSAQLGIDSSKDWQKILEDVREALYAFLDPVTGNFGNTGFGFDEIPDPELIKKFFFSIPDIDNAEITVSAASPNGSLCVYIPDKLELKLLTERA